MSKIDLKKLRDIAMHEKAGREKRQLDIDTGKVKVKKGNSMFGGSDTLPEGMEENMLKNHQQMKAGDDL